MTPRASPRPCRSCTSSCSQPGGWSETSARRWPSSETFSGRADRESALRSRSFRGRAGRVTSNSASSMESTGPTPSMWSSSNGSKGGRHLLKGRRRLAIEVRRSIEEPARVGKLWEAMERGRANRAATIEKTGLDLPAFRDRVRLIKETAAQDPSIAEAFAEAVRANGGRVFFAATGRQAVQYVLDVCRANGAEFLVKSKSLTSEEVEMNQGLAAEGIRAIETDLGELLCQVAGEKPSHLVFPVIILDNGRTRMRADPSFREALNCIRCGACMNVCPTYGVTGGHVFGHIYPGPIGIPWTANVHGLEEASFAHLCVSCGLCHEICPVDIDIPLMIAKVKDQDVEAHGQPTAERFFMASEAFAKVACLSAPLANRLLRRGSLRVLMEWAVGVDRRRTLPAFAHRTLRSRFRAREGQVGRVGKVAFFPDLYAEYNNPDQGLRAIEILERLGYSVFIPNVQWSGMPYVSYGRLGKATKLAADNLRVLGPLVDDGYEIVSTEPTAVYMLRKVYPKLLEGDLASKVATHSRGFFEFIEPHLTKLSLRPTTDAAGLVGFHIPCHDRALSSGLPAMRFLERASYRVRPVETGTCCGIAGTFGMKGGWLGYELSMAVGEKLFEQFRGSGCDLIATESSVCTLQLQDGLGRPVRHPLDLVRVEGPA